jgi:chemotaxis protein MotB
VNAFGGISSVPLVKGDLQPSVAPNLPRLAARRPQGAGALRKEREELTGVARDIQKVLAPLVKQGKVRVTQTDRGVSVEINASVLFAPGDAKLSESTSEALRAVAAVLRDDDHDIQVEGHTDSVPIRNAQFPSNWELSAVRASSVVRLFVDNGVKETRLVAIGRGSTLPVDSNKTPEGRLRNRRVEITVLAFLPEIQKEVPVVP